MTSIDEIKQLKKDLVAMKKMIKKDMLKAEPQVTSVLMRVARLKKDKEILSVKKHVDQLNEIEGMCILYRNQVQSIKEFKEKYKK